ncbi:hypothetical protein P9139_00555 [Curtobacterium flaccumfaciens]|nr:hypothetical protein P9139_00555 [Curtobacterium flaccumfaciens]
MAKPTRSTGNTQDSAEPPVTFNRTERALAFMVGGSSSPHSSAWRR